MIYRITASQAKRWLPQRPLSAHKGSCGRVYILAGSRWMAGAGILSSWGAVTAGAGLVRLGTVKSRQNIAAKRAPLETTLDGFSEDRSGHIDGSKLSPIKKLVSQFHPDVMVLGPGLGSRPSTQKIVFSFLKSGADGLVLDADALNVLPVRGRKILSKIPCIITPHPGELARLLGKSIKNIQADRKGSAIRAAKLFGCICLLKGAQTLVTDGRTVWKNTTGNPAMASAGMGDVLAGVVAALWGQMKTRTLDTALVAAALGAYLHGLAGDLAAHKIKGLSVQASKAAEFIPSAIRQLKGVSS